MSFHTKKSPSQGKRIAKCPGSLAMCAVLPPEQKKISGPAARLGTATHFLIELCLSGDKSPVDFIDRLIVLKGENEETSMLKPNAKTPTGDRVYWFVVDADMIEAANHATDYVNYQLFRYNLPRSRMQCESRTNPLPERDDTSGTADVTLDLPEELEVVDFKNGYIHVGEKKNPQLKSYLLGKAIDTGWRHKRYKVTVIQPASGEKGLEIIRSVTYTKAQLLQFQKWYRKVIEKSDEAECHEKAPTTHKHTDPVWLKTYVHAADPTASSGESHCTFCDRQATCPAYADMIQEVAQLDFSEPAPKSIPFDENEIGDKLKFAPVIEAYFRAVASYGMRAVEAGRKIKGYKAVRKKTNRRFKEDDEAIRTTKILAWAKKAKVDLPRDKLFKLVMLSGPQIEKLLPRKQWESFSNAILWSPPGELTLVPEDDPRDAVEVSPETSFANSDLDDQWLPDSDEGFG